jgi:transcriptional regulator with XRE-family HTH domain
MISPHQCRAARDLLHWTAAHLAHVAGVGIATVDRFETGRQVLGPETLRKLQRALEDEGGVEFLPQHGVRFQKSRAEKVRAD